MRYAEQRTTEGHLATLLVMGLCVSMFFIDPLVNELFILPYAFSWLPELFAGAAAVLVVITLARSSRIMIRPVYIALFIFLLAIVIAGWVLNEVHGWTVVAGIRVYFRYLPLFLLPLVVALSDADVKRQLRFIAAILIFQFPMVVLQKWILDYPPDHVTGTAMIGSTLSFLLISGIGFVLALFLRGWLSLGLATLLGFLFFFPTTINETKGTLVMLPISMATTFLLARKNAARQVSSVAAFGLIAALVSVFFLMYSLTLPDRFSQRDSDERGGLVEFFADPDKGIIRYIFSGDASL